MESGPCRLSAGESPCPCTEGRFEITSGPPDPSLFCQNENCRHQLQDHFFAYNNLALFGLPPSANTLALYDRPVSGQSAGASGPLVRRSAMLGIQSGFHTYIGGSWPNLGLEIEHGKRLEIIDRASDLLKRIKSQTPEDPLDLATPAERLIALPFPSLLPTLPRGRFGFDSKGNWGYMAREKFKELLQAVDELLESTGVDLLFYGTIGYGKSHLLAALVCYLFSTGSQVIYIPDCQQCLRNPVEYVRTAMLLAWVGNYALQMEIMDLETRLDILGFLDDRAAEGRQVVFVIDQMNALEPTGENSESADDLRNKES